MLILNNCLLLLLIIAAEQNSYTMQVATPPVTLFLLAKPQALLQQLGGQLICGDLGRWEELLRPCVEGTLWRQRKHQNEKERKSIPGMAERVHTDLGPLIPTAFSLSFRIGPVV